MIAVGALLWGAVIGATEPLLRTLMQIDAPEEYVGRVMGTAQVHRSAGEIVPLALAPGLAAAFGVQTVMIAGAVLAAVVALLTIPSRREARPRASKLALGPARRGDVDRRSRSARSPRLRRRHRSSLANNRSAIHRPSMSGPACYSDRDILWFDVALRGTVTVCQKIAFARAKWTTCSARFSPSRPPMRRTRCCSTCAPSARSRRWRSGSRSRGCSAAGEHYTAIQEATGASATTISRVSKSLNYGADGYARVLERLGDGLRAASQ